MLPARKGSVAFFSTGGRPPPGCRMRSVGCAASEAANSSRPRRIAFSSTPVISNSRRSAPWPSRCDPTARYHLRCCSSNRLSSRFIWRWYSRSGCSSPEPHSAHWHDRTTPAGTLSSPLCFPPTHRCAYPTLIRSRPVEGQPKPELVLLRRLSGASIKSGPALPIVLSRTSAANGKTAGWLFGYGNSQTMNGTSWRAEPARAPRRCGWWSAPT